jgi:ketosteroid isomerase-like protein
MRRTSLINILVFVVGLGIGYFARGAVGMLQRRTQAADLAAIKKLEQEDIEVTLSQDPKGLADLWAEDGMRITPGNPPTVVGKAAVAAENAKFHAQYPGFKVLSYTSKYKNLQIEDGLAWEWFEKKGEYKLSPESPSASWRAKGLVVLKRQNDGSWKGEMIFPVSWDELATGGNAKTQ